MMVGPFTVRAASIFTVVALFAYGLFRALGSQYDTPTTAVQAIWTTAGTVGAILSLANLWDAIGKLRALKDHGVNGDYRFIALEGIRIEALRCVQMLCITGIGLYLLQST